MSVPAKAISAIWLLDVEHPDGTIYSATRDTDSPDEVTAFGAFYAGRILNDIIVTHELSDLQYGIVAPATLSVVLSNSPLAGTPASLPFDPTKEWRKVPVRLRRVTWDTNWDDSTTETITSEFSGIITAVNFRHARAIFSCASHDDSVLNELIPKYTVSSTDFTAATDLGKCVPKVYGRGAVVRPVYISYDPTGDADSAGGADWLVSWQSAAATPVEVEAVYTDLELDSPGLELETEWEDLPGAPYYVAADSFAASGNGIDKQYGIGDVVRVGSADPYDYAAITAKSYTEMAGTPGQYRVTLTLSSAILTDPLPANIRYACRYIVEHNRYSYNTRDATSLRFSEPAAGIVVWASETAITNPADVIEDILTDTVYGLSQSVDATTFAQAVTDFAAAGLGSAVVGALGQDGQQRTAREVLRELCMMRGARLAYDGQLAAWTLVVDTDPGASVRTFGFGDGEYNNIFRVEYAGTTPLGQCVATMKLRYGQGGRGFGLNKWSPADYQYEISKSVLAVGSTMSIVSPWLRRFAQAARVLDYLAKKELYSDNSVVIVVGQEGRDLVLGDRITVTIPSSGVDGDYTVSRIERTLASTKLTCHGYDAAIYTDTSGTITAPTAAAVDERLATVQSGVNFITNPDFAAGFESVFDPTNTAHRWPGWKLSYDGISTASITEDADCTGGYFLSVTVTDATNAQLLRGIALEYGEAYTYPTIDNTSYCLSWYADNIAGIEVTMAGTPSWPRISTSSSDVNRKGWPRRYVVVRAGTDGLQVWVQMVQSGTFKFDAFQLEMLAKGMTGPSPWKRHATFGVNPSQIQPGNMTIRASAGDPEMGTSIRHVVSSETTLSGASTSISALLPDGAIVDGVTIRVTQAITFSSGSTYSVGTTVAPDAWGAYLTKTTLGDTTSAADFTTAQPMVVNGGTDLVIWADSGSFSGGKIVATVHYRILVPASA